MSMHRRGIAGIVLAAVLALGLSSVAMADTFGGPAGNETSASAGFTQVVGGVEYDWSLLADRDTVAGYSSVGASYSAVVDLICHGGDQNGQAGYRFISFGADTSMPFVVTATLGAAAAGARVTGIEDTFDTCTGVDTTVTKRFTFAFALRATSAASSFRDQQCVDFSDAGDAPMLLTETGASRDAAGAAIVNGRRFALTDGAIGHVKWNSVADSSCAP